MHDDEARLKARYDDRLAQRFVDQELTDAERERFAGRLGREDGLRRRVMALQRIAAFESRASKPFASAAFVAGVLERTSAIRPAPVCTSRFAWLFTPHTMHWNLAQAAAVVVVAVAAGFGVARTIDSRPTPAAAGAAGPAMVRLVVLQPDARTVNAVGDFNGWDPARTSLQQVSSGVWSVTLPLTPGRYEYMFVVDGQRWVGDPAAIEQSDDGFGSRNAVLEVLAPGAGL
jgi:anti-sigma-K factor RskA